MQLKFERAAAGLNISVFTARYPYLPISFNTISVCVCLCKKKADVNAITVKDIFVFLVLNAYYVLVPSRVITFDLKNNYKNYAVYENIQCLLDFFNIL